MSGWIASIIPVKKPDDKVINVPKMTPSMMVVGAITFVGDSSRGVLFPVLQALCAALQGSEIDLGYLVAMFSLGRLVVTTPLGYMSDKYRQRLPLVISSTTLAIGGLLWANSYPTNSIASLYISQFIMGCGSGSLGVTRSYVVERSHPKVRTETLALMTALQYAGFTVSPLFGSLLAYFGTLISSYWVYALPGYSIGLAALYCVIALLTVFEDSTPAQPSSQPSGVVNQIGRETAGTNSIVDAKGGESKDSALDNGNEGKSVERELQLVELGEAHKKTQQTVAREHHIDDHGSVPFQVDNTVMNPLHALRTPPGGYEPLSSTEPTIIAPSTSEQQPTQPQATDPTNPSAPTTKYDKHVTSFCVVAMILLNVTTKGSISVYETIGAHIAVSRYGMTVTEVGILVTCCGLFGFIQLLLFKSFWTKYFSDMTLMLGGMMTMIFSQLIAVSYASEPSKSAFLVSFIIMYAIGYPIGHTAVLGAFSKIQKKGTQGALMGYFATAGSAARIVIPIITGYLDKAVNNAPFCIVMFLLTISYGCLILLRPVLQGLIEDDDDPSFDGNLWHTWRCLTKREKVQIALMICLFSFSFVALLALSTGQGLGWNDAESIWDLDER